jgi:hypothetical protein
VDASGAVTFVDRATAPVLGSVELLDVEALAARVTSSDADALFSGADPSCPPSGVLQGLDVLHRSRDADGTRVTDDADISLCLTGVASELRARMGLARSRTAP